MQTRTPLPAAVQQITCDNPSPMTLEGTNTYLIGDSGAAGVVVIDPGPDGHPKHVRAILEAAGSRRITEILVTHRHSDHLGAATQLAAQTGAPVRGFDPEVCLPGDRGATIPLAEGEEITAGGTSITVLHTPGHTSDSVCFWMSEAGAVLTGDTMLGRGTTMLDYPDGTLTDYLATLERLAEYDAAVLLPAHGPLHPQLGPVAEHYIRHRLQRLEQVRDLLAEHGPMGAEQLGRHLYGEHSELDPRVISKIAGAQLDYLREL
ncbi:MBL fold metallo-hydrolase [Nesterenkonia ebinurensis]|uniref:MBL fold metallo-hydrolase n=1 Tax=Nesterenkonia ebinurensis TaxID=2608252 RepID=UPI00123D8234|nr:MBL fold metallo-hydrolase [Nesterenkonia ebinurensis]